MSEPGICHRHGLPGISHTYASAWASYEQYGSFLYLVECFQECRRLKWPFPEPLLAAMDRHFDALINADDVADARLALGVGTSCDGGEVQFTRAQIQAEHDQLQHLLDAVQAFGVTKRKDQFTSVANLTGRSWKAVKTAYYRHLAKK